MNSKIVTFCTILHVTIHVLQKIMIFRKNIPRERKNYVGFFDASCVGNGCRNNNLMNSKILTFCTNLHVTIHVLQKNYDISEKKKIPRERENYVDFFLPKLCYKRMSLFIKLLFRHLFPKRHAAKRST